MKTVTVLGAGRSSASLITYLLEHAVENDWMVQVVDANLEHAEEKVQGNSRGRAMAFDVNNIAQTEVLVVTSDVIVSLLPAHLHSMVASKCVQFGKHMITASYVSEDMKELSTQAMEKGILLLNEMGLDPGIDHMSAMHIIDRTKAAGGKITSFKSWCGGLIAPESNDNPWNYKFTWNPRNVVLAGQGTAKFIENGSYRYLPYSRIFKELEQIDIEGVGNLTGYANRDSLSYRDVYGLSTIPTMIRGTLRGSGYCEAWDILVQLGITDDTYVLENAAELSYSQWIKAYLPSHLQKFKTDEGLAQFYGIPLKDERIEKLRWLGLFKETKIADQQATPAQILQSLLESKWKLKKGDKDMIVMLHQFEIEQEGKVENIVSSLTVKGDDEHYTAMAKTVGLPMAIAAKLLLTDQLKGAGVHIPVSKAIYEPVLAELANHGIEFKESKISRS